MLISCISSEDLSATFMAPLSGFDDSEVSELAHTTFVLPKRVADMIDKHSF